MDFKEWFNKELANDKRSAVYIAGAKRGFEAGQQSKQAEIDALQKRINELTKWAEFHIKDYNSSESDSEHDRGWFNAACQVFKSLKGEQK